jgi:negative regulator of sigma E activity
MFRDTMKMVAVSGVVSLAVSFGMLHANPATQAAQASEAQSVPAAAQTRQSANEAYDDSNSVVEVYSDGGYTYWLEHAGSQG